MLLVVDGVGRVGQCAISRRRRKRRLVPAHLDVVLANHELLHLIELVDAEDAANVPSARTSLLAEAGREAGVALKVVVGNPLKSNVFLFFSKVNPRQTNFLLKRSFTALCVEGSEHD